MTILSSADVARYFDEGYLVVRSLLDEESLRALQDGVNELSEFAKSLTDDTFIGPTYFNLLRDCNPFAKNADVTAKIAGRLRRVTYPYAYNPTLARLRLHERLLEVMADIHGGDLCQIVNQVNYSPPGLKSGWGWHQDYRFRKPGIDDMLNNFTQSIVALDPCNPHTGGVRLIPRSHRLGAFELDRDNENAESHFDASQAVTPELDRGDALLFNPYVIHGSGPNRSDAERRVYINGYANQNMSKVGQTVMVKGRILKEPTGIMEYEGEQELLAKASKY